MKEEILKALESVRPFLQADNGDIELVEVTETGIVKDCWANVKNVLFR